MSGPRRKRILTSDETALWSLVTRHVTPLHPASAADPADEKPVSDLAEQVSRPKVSPKSLNETGKRPERPSNPVPEPVPPLVPLERRLRQRLSRGQQPIEAVIDLHGRRQAEAHEALRRFIVDAHRMGHKVVLVVTGKGASEPSDHGLFEERGVLRRTVPHWLRLPDMRPFVIGFETAQQPHGGSGALYVRIRRQRGGIDL